MLPLLRRPAWRAHLCRYDHLRQFTTSSVTRKDLKRWSDTLLLPATNLPLKHKDPLAAELIYRSRTTDELYRQQVCM